MLRSALSRWRLSAPAASPLPRATFAPAFAAPWNPARSFTADTPPPERFKKKKRSGFLKRFGFEREPKPVINFNPDATLNAFRDQVPKRQRSLENVGRSWHARNLRRKSFDDLHKLWLVLYKEKNMLLTEKQLATRNNIWFVQPERLHKVKKSMGAIRHVLGERKREMLAEKYPDGMPQKEIFWRPKKRGRKTYLWKSRGPDRQREYWKAQRELPHDDEETE